MSEDGETQKRVNDAMAKIYKTEGDLVGHERLCAERYHNILGKIEELQVSINLYVKIGFILSVVLFSIELSRATIPNIIDAILRVPPIHGER